ncbi:MAG: UbiA family prenyltransferase [Chitinivibrionia bacterium]|nr:UbiA family prenyltransferase [Chitinivibrionia bacterium]
MPLKKVAIFVFDLFFLNRPTLLVPVWTILFLGWTTAQPREIFDFSFDFASPFVKMFFAFTAVVCHIYIVNQIVDRKSDKINNKLFLLSNGHIPVGAAWLQALLLLAFSVVIAWIWLDLVSVFIILTAAFLGFLYNCAPFKLKDRPWGGFIANALGHGMLTYYAGWYATQIGATSGGVNLSPPFGIPMVGFLFALSAAFANGAVYLTSTISDIKGDENVGKRTFAVAFGAKNTSLLAAICVVISFLTAFFIPHSLWIMAIPAAICIPLFFRLYIAQDVKNAFKTFRYPVVILSVMIAIFVPVYAILVFATVILSRIYYKMRFNHEYPSFSKE